MLIAFFIKWLKTDLSEYCHKLYMDGWIDGWMDGQTD